MDEPPEEPQFQDTLLKPTNDVVWKLLLAAPSRRHLLLSLVNAVIRPPEPFTSIEVLNPTITPQEISEKGSVLDILAVTPDGSLIHLEMQNRRETHFRRRAFYYAAKVYAAQLETGNKYQQLQSVYSINLLNFGHFRDTLPYRFARILTTMDKDSGEEYPEFVTMYFLELTKFRKFIKKHPLGSGHWSLEHWLQFISNPADKRMETMMRTDPIFKDVMKGLRQISQDPDAKELARMREKAQRDFDSSMDSALQKGLKKGRAEGAVSATQKLLRSMLLSPKTASLSDADIADLIGLPVADVTEMRRRLQTTPESGED